MPQILPTRLTYAESFRCIGSACEDTCCQGWSVPVDQAAYEKFQQLPDGPLRSLIEASMIEASILSAPPGAVDEKAFKSASFAQIRMDSQNQCPLLTEERLCRIHASLGEGFLPRICATYPRVVNEIGGFEETALALSCPEAARLVLLHPDLLAPARLAQKGLATTGESSCEPAAAAATDGRLSLLPWFRPIRQAVLARVGNRAYPLWQRQANSRR